MFRTQQLQSCAVGERIFAPIWAYWTGFVVMKELAHSLRPYVTAHFNASQDIDKILPMETLICGLWGYTRRHI